MANKSYITKTPIRRNDEDIEIGSSIELDDKTEAPQLLDVGAIELDTKAKKTAIEK